ncbi:MAG: ABC transporter ATP-binding protein [Planctomycetes bacterium]|nr:ABC transporter ATP-binding protein [Planctomycetota bacterium]
MEPLTSVTPLLEVHGLRVALSAGRGSASVVDGLSFGLKPGQTLTLVGESGCGKTMTALALMRLLPPAAAIAAGSIQLADRDLAALPESALRDLRGNQMAMIFQEPMTSLNPVLTVGEQIAEAAMIHQQLSLGEALSRAAEMLKLVHIPSPETALRRYPHELSGGMRQRAMIAMALMCRPKLLIADEPTTALDVTVQAQILALLRRLQRELQMALLLITHDLGVVAEMADQVAVMYAGQIIEQAEVRELFSHPKHPYTVGLFGSLPQRVAVGAIHELPLRPARLKPIAGSVPSPFDLPSGCRFWPRCPQVFDRCKTDAPELTEAAPGHAAACWLMAR